MLTQSRFESQALNLAHRILAEVLVRRRGSDERLRYAAAQTRGKIDANPHQIDAVVFAIDRIPDGGRLDHLVRKDGEAKKLKHRSGGSRGR
jgi:hypothetical protein